VDNDQAVDASEILQQNHYYPFGMNQEGAWGAPTNTTENRYQYNGKELNTDFGLNLNDYGARWYDAALGRWGAVDALADEPEQIDKSNYAYAWNNPLGLNDPDGNCPSCVVGGIIGAAVEYGGQVIANRIEGKSWEESFTDIDVADVLISGAEGFVTNGTSAIKNVALKGTIKVGAELARNTLDVKKDEVKVNSTPNVIKNTAIGLSVDGASSLVPTPKANVVKEVSPKQAVKTARAEAKQKGEIVNRVDRLRVEANAKKNLKEAKAINNTISGAPIGVISSGTSESMKRKTDK
jgi:RHS repeat-associated protein